MDKEKEQKWDREMAEVDKLLARLPEADPYLKGDATTRRTGAPGAGEAATTGAAPKTLRTTG